MQRQKNIILLVIFGLLLAWTIIYVNMDYEQNAIALDEEAFAVQDTVSITKVTIEGPGISNVLSRDNGAWMVNHKYPLDPSMKRVLLSVLNQVRIRRTVPKNDLDRIREDILENGYRITILHENGRERNFFAGGNGISLSYFMDDDGIPYVVHLPGYESYVTGIFEVRENDWRDRLIFQTSWIGIKSYQLRYPENPEKDIHIRAEDDLYRIEGVEKLDTLRLMGYLDEISYFFADQYIDSGQLPVYDSLKGTKPFATLTVNSLGFDQAVRIDFYPALRGEQVRLGIINDRQMCLFSTERIAPIFEERGVFVLNE